MASVDARDARGNTALHWAQMGGVEQDSLRWSPLMVHFHGYAMLLSMLYSNISNIQSSI